MDLHQVTVLAIFIMLIGALIFANKRPAFPFSLALLALLLTNSIAIPQVFENATNTSVIALILLLLVSSVIERTQLLRKASRILIKPSLNSSYFRIFSLTALASALLNNTAVVSSLLSGVSNNKQHMPSQLLIPLSYAAILGGTITLIGTSTNLIVNSFLLKETTSSFAFFDFLLFGLGATLSCGVLLYLLLPMLPKHQIKVADRKDYFIETQVSAHSPLVGNSIEDNQLRQLGDLYLSEIVRDKALVSPVSPHEIIQANDKLIFSGDIKHIDILQQFKGLELFADCNGLLTSNLAEVVISNRSMLIGKDLKSVGFRALFDAAVVAIRRDGARLSGKLGELKLRAGDVLVLATGADFTTRQNLTKNFFFLSDIQLPRKLTPIQEWLAPLAFLGALSLSAAGVISLVEALIYLLALFGFSNVISSNDIKRKLPLDLWLIITSSLCLASAIQQTNLESYIHAALQPVAALNQPLYVFIGIFVLTALLTELVTNNAAAALMFPVALGAAHSLNIDIEAMAMTVALAASASFISPYSYQTNLMIFNAGNYSIKDFAKIGLPVSFCYGITCLTLINYFYL